MGVLTQVAATREPEASNTWGWGQAEGRGEAGEAGTRGWRRLELRELLQRVAADSASADVAPPHLCVPPLDLLLGAPAQPVADGLHGEGGKGAKAGTERL